MKYLFNAEIGNRAIPAVAVCGDYTADRKTGVLAVEVDLPNYDAALHYGFALAYSLRQDCVAYVDMSYPTRRGFVGPDTYSYEKAGWDKSKFYGLYGKLYEEPAPVRGNLSTTLPISFGNDTPVQWCLWDTDTGLYVAACITQDPCVFDDRAGAEASLAAARAADWQHWTTRRPTSK